MNLSYGITVLFILLTSYDNSYLLNLSILLLIINDE